MGRNKKHPWGDVHKVKKRNDKKDPRKFVEVEVSHRPKKLTKGLKRQLRRLLEQNPNEAHRQMAIIGCTEQQVAKSKGRR